MKLEISSLTLPCPTFLLSISCGMLINLYLKHLEISPKWFGLYKISYSYCVVKLRWIEVLHSRSMSLTSFDLIHDFDKVLFRLFNDNPSQVWFFNHWVWVIRHTYVSKCSSSTKSAHNKGRWSNLQISFRSIYFKRANFFFDSIMFWNN